MPDTGVLRVLTAQQRATGWRRQVEVEKSLGLEKGAISSYFVKLGRVHKSKSRFAAPSPPPLERESSTFREIVFHLSREGEPGYSYFRMC